MPSISSLLLSVALAGAGAVASAAAAAAAASQSGAEPPVGKRQPVIERIVAQVSHRRIEANVRKLVSFHTRHTLSETESDTIGIGAARRWIKSELERCSAQAGGRLQVAFDSHVAPVSARIARPIEVVNVVATLPGTDPASSARMYVVSGHYDSRNSDIMDASGYAPGANDDASGVAAVMEMACVMARHSFDATLVFMAVASEEQGLQGAAHWAEQARLKQLNVAGMFTNDIIGSSRAENGKVDDMQVRLFAEALPAARELSEASRALIATGGENDSLSRQLARHVKGMGERYVPGFKVNVIGRRDRYLRGGDHLPFLERGFAALRFTEPNENFDHQHQNVRKENGKQYGDLPEFVDYRYVAKVARVNAAALASLASGPAAPGGVRLLTDKLENASRLVWDANSEPDLSGYRIVWRETGAADWQGARYVGKLTQASIDLSKDNYYFGVQAVDKDGNVSVATYPLPQR